MSIFLISFLQFKQNPNIKINCLIYIKYMYKNNRNNIKKLCIHQTTVLQKCYKKYQRTLKKTEFGV